MEAIVFFETTATICVGHIYLVRSSQTMESAIWRNYAGQIGLLTIGQVIGAVIRAHDYFTSHNSNKETNIGYIIYLGSLKRDELSSLSKSVNLTTYTNT
jgi:hypothetical protein